MENLVELVRNMSISEGLDGKHIDVIASNEAGGKEESNQLEVPLVIAKMDSSQHTLLTNLIIFSYQTAVNIYKKILKKNAYTN